MDFGLCEEVEPTGSTSEGMWERRVAPGRSSAVTSVGGVSGFGMGFGGSVVADASRCLGASQEPCRLLGRPWASGGRVGSAVSPVKTRWKPARSRRAPWGSLLPAAPAAGAAGRRSAATLWARGAHATLAVTEEAGRAPEPLPGPPAGTLGFSGQVALPTSKGHRRLLEGCMASAGHTSALAYQQITRQICEWGRGTGSVGFLGRGHASASLRTSMLPRQRLTGSSFPLAAPVPSRVCPHCPQTHDRTPRAERPRPVCSLCRGARPLRPRQRVSSLTPGAPSVARRRVFDSPMNVHGGPLAPKQQNPKTSPGTRAGFPGFLCGSYGPGLGLRGLSRCPSGCVEQSAVFCRCFSGAESH